MTCPKCGVENTPESKFCTGCGSPLSPVQEAPAATEAPVAPVAPKTTSKSASGFDINELKDQLLDAVKPVVSKVKSLWANKKIRLGVIGAAALLLVLVVVCFALSGDNGYIKLEENIRCVQSEEGVYSVIVGKKVLKTTIESEGGIDSISHSMDGKVAAILTEEGDLYAVKGSKVTSIADDVLSYTLSVNGKGIAYSTRAEDNENTFLYLAKVSNGKSAKITDNLSKSSFHTSPDGKSVAYFEAGSEEDSHKLMLYKGKKRTEICDGEGTSLYGLSNNGKQIYVSIANEDSKDLYAFNAKGKKTKLGSFAGSVYFNDDHTQVMFRNEEGKTYISTKGKDAIKATSNSLSLIIAPGSSSTGNTYPVSNLYGHVYRSGDEAHLIKKNKDIKLVSKASDLQLDGSAEYLYYTYNNREVRYIKISKGERASERAKTIIGTDVSFAVTADRKYVYFIDGGALMSVNAKHGGRPKQISDDIDVSAGLAISNKDIVYYVVDDDLYAVSNGKRGRKVVGDVDYVTSSANGYVYATNDDSLFVSTGAKKPKKVLDRDI